MKNNTLCKLILFLILICASLLRLSYVNWDYGGHMHPDERAIIMAVTNLKIPASIQEFLSPESPFNPHFFAYGSFPFYLLFLAGHVLSPIDFPLGSYDGINLVGRILSGLFDIGTVLMLFLLGKKVFSRKVGLIASFFYAFCVLPIQLSHFYAVDTLLTFFIVTNLLMLVHFYDKPTRIKALGVGILFGLSLATKISASVLIASIVTTIAVDFFLLFLRQPHKPKQYVPHIPLFIKRLFIDGLIIAVATTLTFFLFEPYALIDHNNFLAQTYQQSLMTKSAFTFPYTLQYVFKLPYLYELTNIILWGQGIPLSLFTLSGVIYSTGSMFVTKNKNKTRHILILLAFFITYFFTVGKFVIGFMRYMLPLYPLFCLFGAVFMYELLSLITHFKLRVVTYVFIALCLIVWPLSFFHIYTKAPTRVQATDWILQNIPSGKTLALEHWDDAVPIHSQERYTLLSFPLYEPDTQAKWDNMQTLLSKTDYIILASNRLYTPLMKLTDCQILPPDRCYTQTTAYYKSLFNGSLGFQKVAEFSVYPTIPILQLPINDQQADESFTVYDHPKIMIFQKK